MCDICGDGTNKYIDVLGGICVCDLCVKNIVILHIYSHKVKLLCPKCHSSTGPCEECDIKNHILKINKCANRLLANLKTLDL